MQERSQGNDADAKRRDARGSYTRADDKGRHGGHAQLAYEHFKEVSEQCSIGRPCFATCEYKRKCPDNLTPAHLLRAHVSIYGSKTTMEERNGTPVYTCAATFSE